jgi:hypothetical protein
MHQQDAPGPPHALNRLPARGPLMLVQLSNQRLLENWVDSCKVLPPLGFRHLCILVWDTLCPAFS